MVLSIGKIPWFCPLESMTFTHGCRMSTCFLLVEGLWVCPWNPRYWTRCIAFALSNAVHGWLPKPVAARSAAAGLLGLRFRIPPGTQMSVSCDRCVLSGRGLCVGVTVRPEEYYRVWFVLIECDISYRRPRATRDIFPWRYTTHSGCVFYNPLSGFSLLA